MGVNTRYLLLTPQNSLFMIQNYSPNVTLGFFVGR